MGFIEDENGEPLLDENGEGIEDEGDIIVSGLVTIGISVSASVNERSSILVTITLTDTAGTVHTIDSISSTEWQLSDIDGTIINNNSFGNSAADDNPIILSGEDLKLTNSGICRIFAVKIVYDSDIGIGLTGTQEAKFHINDLVNIS